MSPRIVSHETGLLEDLEKPEFAAEYLTACIENDIENGENILCRAIGQLARARGVTELARSIEISRDSIYKALSDEGNASFLMLRDILEQLDLGLVIVPKSKAG